MSNLSWLLVATIALLAAGCNQALRADEAILRNDLFRVRGAMDQYYNEHRKCPPTLDSLVGGGYLTAVPVDPFTGSSSSWLVTFGGGDAVCPSGERGIAELHSGSDRVSLDGTKYSDW
jgi:general secretion pathway protein G